MIKKSDFLFFASVQCVFYALLAYMVYRFPQWVTLDPDLVWANLLISILLLITGHNFVRKLMVALGCINVSYGLVNFFLVLQQFDWPLFLFLVMGFAAATYGMSPQVEWAFRWKFSPPGWKILLIDDDKTLRKVLSARFSDLGIRFQTAASGEEGLKTALDNPPDLILLDVILPGIKGREVCDRLKEDSRTKDIPVMFLTVQDSPDDKSAELNVGAVAHLTKPVSFQRLLKEIEKILGR